MRQVKEKENCQETKKSKPGQAMIQMTGIKKEKKKAAVIEEYNGEVENMHTWLSTDRWKVLKRVKCKCW